MKPTNTETKRKTLPFAHYQREHRKITRVVSTILDLRAANNQQPLAHGTTAKLARANKIQVQSLRNALSKQMIKRAWMV